MASQKMKEIVSKIFILIFGFIFLGGSFYQLSGMFSVTPDQHIARAEAQIQKQDWQAAREHIAAVKEKAPQDYRAYMLEGQVFRYQKQYEQALSAFEQAAQKDRSNATVYEMIGVIQIQLDQKKPAREAFEKAISFQSNNPLAHANLGVLDLEAKQFQSAENHFLDALKYEPNFPDAHRNLGILYQMTKQNLKAQQHFELYLKLMPNAPEREAIERWLADNGVGAAP